MQAFVMPSLSFMVLSLCITTLIPSETDKYFEGKITYKYTFLDPKTGKDITNQYTETIGTKQVYFVDEYHYKSINDWGKLTQLYDAESNTYYSFDGKENKAYKLPAEHRTSSSLSINHPDSTAIILNRECHIVTLTSNLSRKIYYYDPELKIDYSNFLNHYFGDWNRFLKATDGAIALKTIVKTDKYIWISEAVEIEWKDLDDSVFKLPKNVEFVE